MRAVPGARRAAAFAAAVLLAVLPRVADAAAPGTLMTGRVTVAGNGSGWLPVTVPRAVDFRAGGAREMHAPSATFTGKAYGWLLVADSPALSRGFAGAVRVPSSLTSAVVFRMDGMVAGRHLFDTAVLPAGRYRLHLLATGPGSVTFRLPGLRGTANVRTRAAERTDAVEHVAPAVGGVRPSAYAEGVTFDHDVATLVLSFTYNHSVAQAAANYGHCEYEGGPPAGTWAPGCPAGSTTIIGVYPPAVGCCGIGFGGGAYGPGRWGYGQWYEVPGVVDAAASFYVLLPLG